jgi:S1/P1 Nuclease
MQGLRAGIEEKTMMAQKRRILIFLSAFLVLLPLRALAWNDVGHMAVAYIAYQRLNPATRTRASALLKLNPDYSNWVKQIPEGTSPQDQEMLIFMIASTWADQIKHESGYMPDGVPGSNGNLPEGAASAQNIGYKDKLQHRYWHFIDMPFSTDGTKLPPVPTPNAETQIAAFRKVLAAASADDDLKSYDLTWLLHIVGDIHQPLHCVTRVSSAELDGDKGGNTEKIVCSECNGASVLHAFWDNILGPGSDPTFALTAAKALPPVESKWASNLDTAAWIQEGVDEARQQVYVAPIADGDGPFTITTAYIGAARKVASARIALAGARLANVLNSELK